MKKLTSDVAKKILKNRPARRFIQSVDDGKVRVIFDSDLIITQEGEEDILGFVWEKDWDKVEARTIINGEPRIYSLGGVEFSFVPEFISVCNKHGIELEDIEGHAFDITKTGDWTQEIEYVGKVDREGKVKEDETEIEEDLINDAIETINDIKENSPDLVKNWKKNDLITALSVRGRMKASEAKSVIKPLEDKNVISVDDDKITVN
jgi:hypothetical protein